MTSRCRQADTALPTVWSQVSYLLGPLLPAVP